MHAGFVLEPRKDVFALDMGHDLFHTTKFGKLLFDQFDFPALRFGIPLVHAQQVSCE